MNIKVHFLHSHVDKFPDDCSDVSDEQGDQNNGRALSGMVGQTNDDWLLL